VHCTDAAQRPIYWQVRGLISELNLQVISADQHSQARHHVVSMPCPCMGSQIRKEGGRSKLWICISKIPSGWPWENRPGIARLRRAKSFNSNVAVSHTKQKELSFSADQLKRPYQLKQPFYLNSIIIFNHSHSHSQCVLHIK
jgi:hypothetical protein